MYKLNTTDKKTICDDHLWYIFNIKVADTTKQKLEMTTIITCIFG